MAIYFRKAKPGLADYAAGALQGVSSGMERASAKRASSLAEAKALADISEAIRKSEAMNAPAPQDYFRDPASGRLYPKDPYRGRGTTVNLPFQFDAGQKDDDGGTFDSPEEAEASGLPQGTVVMVMNPATGQLEEYEI